MNCLDAETLAAWFDDGLSGAALEDVRAHVAGCARCQALVGRDGPHACGGSVDPSPNATPRWWLAWAVPAAAAATARGDLGRGPAARRMSRSVLRRRRCSSRKCRDRAHAPAPAATGEPAASPASTASTERCRTEHGRLKHRRLSPAKPPTTRRSRRQATLNEAVSVRSAAPATGATERRDEAERPNARGRTAAGPRAFATSPLRPHVAAARPPDVASQITAGPSPSADVCWIVGRAGTVLLLNRPSNLAARERSASPSDLVANYRDRCAHGHRHRRRRPDVFHGRRRRYLESAVERAEISEQTPLKTRVPEPPGSCNKSESRLQEIRVAPFYGKGATHVLTTSVRSAGHRVDAGRRVRRPASASRRRRRRRPSPPRRSTIRRSSRSPSTTRTSRSCATSATSRSPAAYRICTSWTSPQPSTPRRSTSDH